MRKALVLVGKTETEVEDVMLRALPPVAGKGGRC
jgi:hypothetical protein